MKRGVKPKALDSAKTSRLVEEIKRGVSPFVACRLAEVSYHTFRRWMRLGNSGYEPYYQFMVTIDNAMRSAGFDAPYVWGTLKPRGRKPADLTKKQRDSIIFAIQQGMSLREASIRADASYSTLKSWLRRGGYHRKLTEAPPIPYVMACEPYKSFVCKVEIAEETAASSVRN